MCSQLIIIYSIYVIHVDLRTLFKISSQLYPFGLSIEPPFHIFISAHGQTVPQFVGELGTDT
jgi:hypothetical protein